MGTMRMVCQVCHSKKDEKLRSSPVQKASARAAPSETKRWHGEELEEARPELYSKYSVDFHMPFCWSRRNFMTFLPGSLTTSLGFSSLSTSFRRLFCCLALQNCTKIIESFEPRSSNHLLSCKQHGTESEMRLHSLLSQQLCHNAICDQQCPARHHRASGEKTWAQAAGGACWKAECPHVSLSPAVIWKGAVKYKVASKCVWFRWVKLFKDVFHFTNTGAENIFENWSNFCPNSQLQVRIFSYFPSCPQSANCLELDNPCKCETQDLVSSGSASAFFLRLRCHKNISLLTTFEALRVVRRNMAGFFKQRTKSSPLGYHNSNRFQRLLIQNAIHKMNMPLAYLPAFIFKHFLLAAKLAQIALLCLNRSQVAE